jgi:hypothetical protein
VLGIQATFAIYWLSQMVRASGIDALVEYLASVAGAHDCPRQLLPVLLFHSQRSTHMFSLFILIYYYISRVNNTWGFGVLGFWGLGFRV